MEDFKFIAILKTKHGGQLDDHGSNDISELRDYIIEEWMPNLDVGDIIEIISGEG